MNWLINTVIKYVMLNNFIAGKSVIYGLLPESLDLLGMRLGRELDNIKLYFLRNNSTLLIFMGIN